jgi:hypothetical protein
MTIPDPDPLVPWGNQPEKLIPMSAYIDIKPDAMAKQIADFVRQDRPLGKPEEHLAHAEYLLCYFEDRVRQNLKALFQETE